MSNRGIKKTRTRSYRGYGAIPTSASTSANFDRTAYNRAWIENMHEPLLNEIRQHTAAETEGPFPSKFRKISRIRRRPILRTKSESDFPGQLSEEAVEQIRVKLIRDHHASFHLKSVPSFTHQQKLVLASIALVDFTSFCSMSILAPFFPQKAQDKGVSIQVSGFIFSFFALVVFIASPMMGVLVGKVGPKFLLLVGVLMCGVSNCLFGVLDMVESTLVFTIYCFVVRFFEAIGAAAFSTASYTYIAKLFPDNIGACLGILETFVGLGLSVGPAIGGVLYDWGGYGLPFWSLGAFMLLTIPLNCFLLPGSDCTGDEPESESMWKLFRIRPIIVIALVVVIVSNAWGFLDPTLSTHLAEFNLSAKQLGLFFLLCSALYGLSSPMWGYIADQITQTWILMAVGLLLSSFGLLLLGPSPILPFVNSIGLNIVALIILGLAISMALLPTFESMLDFAIDGGYPDDVRLYGLIAGLWSSMYSLGEVIGPSLGASLTDHFGFEVCATVQSALCFVLGVTVLIYFLFFYHLPPQSSSRGERARERDKLPTECADSGISENDENAISSASSSHSLQSLLDQQLERHSSKRESTVIEIQVNENSPLLLAPPRRRRYSFDVYVPEYTSESALSAATHTTSARNRKKSAVLSQYTNINPASPSHLMSFPAADQYVMSVSVSNPHLHHQQQVDYGASYPEILKTMSITAFGAVEV